MNARLAPAVVVLILGSLLLAVPPMISRISANAQEPLAIVVTSSEDASDAICPDPDLCTLRAALAAAEGAADGIEAVITFDGDVFPEEDPALIRLAAPLDPVTRDGLVIDGAGAGVVVSGYDFVFEEAASSGLRLLGERTAVRGIGLRDFAGACLDLRGDQSIADGNQLESCSTGLRLAGTGSLATANAAGIEADESDALRMETGIRVVAGSVTLGGEEALDGNRIGNTAVAVSIHGNDEALTGIVVRRNVFGSSTGSEPEPVEVAIHVTGATAAVDIRQNTFANVTGSTIQVGASVNANLTRGVTIRGNLFDEVGAPAIDLGSDGIANPHDVGDIDGGPNGMLDAPVITKATQSQISGTACDNCAIELYLADHEPGGADDHGTAPLAGGEVAASASGVFTLPSPPVVPGQWLTALVTDDAGNTSEFAISTRVGSGVIQCGNTGLDAGWTHSGFFGNTPVSLTGGAPFDASGHVRAIFSLTDGSGTFRQWSRDTAIGQTLFMLEPGETYWFQADQPITLPDGFALTSPLEVDLVEGWNDFVYFGATAHLLDAFATLGDRYSDVYRYVGAGSLSGWELFMREGPEWASGLTSATACAAYQIFLDRDGTLTPLQP